MFLLMQNPSSIWKKIQVDESRRIKFKWFLKKYLISNLIWFFWMKRVMKFTNQKITPPTIFALQKNWEIFGNKNYSAFECHIESFLIDWHNWFFTSLLLHKFSSEEQQSVNHQNMFWKVIFFNLSGFDMFVLFKLTFISDKLSRFNSLKHWIEFKGIKFEFLSSSHLNKRQNLFSKFLSKSFHFSFFNASHRHDCLILKSDIFATIHQWFRKILTVNAVKK